MFRAMLRGMLIAGCLTLAALGQKHVVYPTLPAAIETPQEVLLLFSGDIADERILLTLNNNRLDALTTAITVYTASGIPTQLPNIDMVASESKMIELSPILKSVGLGGQELGWLKLNYTGTFLEMGAQLTLYPTKDGPGVDSPRSLSADFKSTERHAVFWMPEGAKAHLALTNGSAASIFVKLHCGELADDFVIAAKMTRVHQIAASQVGMFNGDQAVPVPCDVTSDGPVDALRAVGMVRGESGYSAPIRFYDTSTSTFSSLTAVGIHTEAETHVTVHNVSDEPVKLIPTLREATLSTPYSESLPSLLVAPHGSIRVEIESLLKSFRDRELALGTLTLQTTALKGALVGALTQISIKDGLIEDIPLRTSNPPAFARGSYPLRWDADYTNMVTVTNTAAEPLALGGAITAGGMTYVLPKTTIDPGSTFVFDADKVKHDAIPDVNGHIIPKDAAYGKIHWIELSNGKKAGLLGRTSLASVSNRRRSSFSCGSTCDQNFYGHPYFDLQIFTSLPQSGNQVSQITDYTETRFARYSTPMQYQSVSSGLYVDYPSVASLGPDSQVTTNLVVSGNSPGSTNMSYTENDAYFAYDPEAQICNETDSFVEQSGPTKVAPKVIFTPISDLPPGGTTTVTATLKDSQGNAISSSSVPIHLKLSVAGTGGATFADGTTDMTITTGGAYQINAVAASSSAGNITLDARVASSDSSGSTSIASPPVSFTVVSVVLSLQTSGSIPLDNGARSYEASTISSTNLGQNLYVQQGGAFACGVSYQVTGTVTPSNYSGQITLRRTASYRAYFDGGAILPTKDNVDDTSPTPYLDTAPQSGGSMGKVYDLDSPSAAVFTTDLVGVTRSLRVNFSEYAVLGAASSTVIVSQANLLFYARSVCKWTDSGAMFDSTFAQDNSVALGTTNLTWNLQ